MMKSTGMRSLVPPPGSQAELSSSDSDEDDSAVPPLMGSNRPALVRRDTFYDKNYESVKISTVPQTTEGWLFFMDMLKTEHRKFKLLLTHLKIERMKIMKEFDAFSNSFQDAKAYIQEQFLTSMTDLRAVNVARLLNGEINKRSSSFIKSTPPKPKRVSMDNNKPPSARAPTRSTIGGNISSALMSVREAFSDVETDGFDGFDNPGYSVKVSTESERLNRPTIPMEYDPDEKTEKRNKLRKKSMVPTFNVSTQTIDTGNSTGKVVISAVSRLEKFRKDSALAEQFQYHARPHALSQPFLGYIRKHEKMYAREIGLMRIAIREFKGLYDHIKLRLDTTLNAASVDNVSPDLLQSLQQIQLLFHDGSWVFDPKFFIRKVNMNPLEDPLDVAAQSNIIISYNEAAEQNQAELERAQEANDVDRVKTLTEVQAELKNLLTDLNLRAREKGGWRALIYSANGAVDMNMSLAPWKPEEQVLILQEKLRYALMKSAEKDRDHEKAVKQLQDAAEHAHSKHRPSLYSPSNHGTTPHSKTRTGAHGPRSHSVSGAMSPTGHGAPRGKGNSNQSDGHDAPRGAPGAGHRHTLTHVNGTGHGPVGSAPGIAASTIPESGASSENGMSSHTSPRTAGSTGYNSDQETGKPIAEAVKVPSSTPAITTEMESSMRQILHTLHSLHTTLESSHTQQEQQQNHIRHLQSIIHSQRQLLSGQARNAGGADKDVLFGSVDGESSLLSLPSQDIIEEYQQIGSGTGSPTKSRPGTASTAQSHAQSGGVRPEGPSGDQKRRSSTLVQHRDGGQIEYVPIGKVGATHNLRITVNNELRGFKHLLLRPASASGSTTAPTRSFASILSGNTASPSPSVGSKAPLSKIHQIESQRRHEHALDVLHHGNPQPSIVTGGLVPLPARSNTTEANSVAIPTPNFIPPSPKGMRRLSNNSLAHELSAIIDDDLSVSQAPSVHSKPDSAAEKSRAATNDAINALLDIHTPGDMLNTINMLCEKLQDSLVLHSAALKTGQELLAGIDGAAPQSQEPASQQKERERLEMFGLHIGESAIDQERPSDAQPRDVRRPSTSHDRMQHSSSLDKSKTIPAKRPKTAGGVAESSRDSYEDLFSDALVGSTATQKHSDVSIYATTLQNRYLHHVVEAKKLEHAIKRLGKASEEDEIQHQQEVAQAHYASQGVFRPQSAAASLPAAHGKGHGSAAAVDPPSQLLTRSIASAARAHSASAAHGAGSGHAAHPVHKERGVTAVPFAKVKPSPGQLRSGSALEGGNSLISPRLQEHSAELSNLSEHEM